ncbi:MAG: hypothetical protein K2Q33_01150, partial [Gammaproteobacteria bacterium]|nr:hypothetical protein [Gammaproteobacteria bacterium]
MVKDKGYLLLEIMITLALSLIVISAVMTMMLNSLTQSRYQSQLFSLQRQFNRVSQLLTYEISSAGYRGCLPVDNAKVLQIESAANVPANWLSKGYPIKANTTAIHLEKMATWHDYLLIDHASEDTQWRISAHQRLKVGDEIMIADCEQSQLAKVLTASLQKDQQIITTTLNNQSFSAGSYVGLWQSKTFYIAKTDRKTTQGEPVWGLYSYEEGQTYEWSDGTNDLQASILQDNQKNTVVMVNVLLSSLERVTHRTQNYFFAGQLHRS